MLAEHELTDTIYLRKLSDYAREFASSSNSKTLLQRSEICTQEILLALGAA